MIYFVFSHLLDRFVESFLSLLLIFYYLHNILFQHEEEKEICFMASTPNLQTRLPAAGAPMSPGYIKRLDVNPSSISFSLFDNALYSPPFALRWMHECSGRWI